MKLQLSKKTLSLCITLSLLGVPLSSTLATAATKAIRATLTPNVTYSLNSKAVLKNSTAISYKGQTYVPIDDLSNPLGYTVIIKGNQIDLATTTNQKPTPPTTPTNTQNIPDAVILAINFEDNTMVVASSSTVTDHAINQVKLKITPDTQITDSRTNKPIAFKDINSALPVKVVYIFNKPAGSNKPAEGTAVSITVLNSSVQPR